MTDQVSVDGALALSDYEAKLVVAALCRYARAGDVHAAHRDRCERLASALAGESSVTLTLSPGAPGAGSGNGELESGRTGVDATADRTSRDGVGETMAVEVASDPGWVASDTAVPSADADGARPAAAEVPADADGAGPEASERRLSADGTRRETTDVPSEAAGETAFRWGPDRADG